MRIITASKSETGWIAVVRCPDCDSGTIYPIGIGAIEQTWPKVVMKSASERLIMDQFSKDHDCEKDNLEPSWVEPARSYYEDKVASSLISRVWTPSTRLG